MLDMTRNVVIDAATRCVTRSLHFVTNGYTTMITLNTAGRPLGLGKDMGTGRVDETEVTSRELYC